MPDPTLLHFTGTDGAIAFAEDTAAAAFRAVAHGWPATAAPGPEGPFAAVRPGADGRWQIALTQPEPRALDHDAVNGICDLVVELTWARLRQDPALMCLHAGGVEIGGGLVVLPAGRRAGKSTLAAEMTRRGHRLFSDDVLAVRLGADGLALGLATGVAPRLRLPLPDDAPAAFAAWVAADPGPANRQYKYLTAAPVAGAREAAPLGAIVTLQRGPEGTAPAVSEIDAAEVLPLLIHQNFGRFVHSGRALAAFGAIARDLPCLRLVYGRFAEAADLLEDLAAAGKLAGRAVAAGARAGAADLANARAAVLVDGGIYQQAQGFTEVEIGGEAYVADAAGAGIFRLNPGMVPVWRLLESPVSAAEIAEVLDEVFPGVGRATLDRDVAAALGALAAAGLIVAAAPDAPAGARA